MLTFLLLAILILCVIVAGILGGLSVAFVVADVFVCGLILFGVIRLIFHF